MPMIDTLIQKLGIKPSSSELIELSLVHKSYGNEHGAEKPANTRDNERLEFVGDAVLDFVISEMLFEGYPASTEGDLSKMRAGLVNEATLSELAKELDLGAYLKLGKGEEHTGGREKDSILASAFEALIAAVYVCTGFVETKAMIVRLFQARVDREGEHEAFGDYKTKLQEVVQARFKSAPRYDVASSSGPDHDKTFEIHLTIQGQVVAKATGKSKKEAEQAAAKLALESLVEK